MADGPRRSEAAPWRQRRGVSLVALLTMVGIAGLLLATIFLNEGVRSEPRAWALIALGCFVVVVAIVVGVRSRSGSAGMPTGLHASERPGHEVEVLEIDDRFDIDLHDLDLTRGPVLRVELDPDPLMRRRLGDRTDALELVADGDGLDVPGWLVHGRSRLIERTDRVAITWSAIDRFRVRASSDGPGVYDITAVADAVGPTRWQIERAPIADEVALLDRVRRVGRVTIVLEDSIRSS